MKKNIIAVVSLLLVNILTACGGGESDADVASTSTTDTQTDTIDTITGVSTGTASDTITTRDRVRITDTRVAQEVSNDTSATDGTSPDTTTDTSLRSWSSVSTLSDELYNATNPTTAITDDGTVWAVWLEEKTPNALYAARLPIGNDKWESAKQIDNGQGNIQSYRFDTVYYSRVNPQIATGGGNTFAVWTQGDGTAVSLYANMFDGNTWGTPIALESYDDTDAYNATVVVDDNGNATVVWNMIGSQSGLYGSHYSQVSKSWSAPQLITQTTTYVSGNMQITLDPDIIDNASIPELILTPAGDPAVAWFEGHIDGSTGLYYSQVEDSVWSSPELITEGKLSAVAMTSSTDDQQSVLTWIQTDESSYDSVYLARRDSGTGWSMPVTVEALPYDAKSSDITALPGGELIVTFNNGVNRSRYVYVVSYSPDKGWAEPKLIYELGGTMPKIVSDSSGSAILIWYASQTVGSIYTATGDWSTPEKLFGYNLGYSHDVKMNSLGDAVVIWYSGIKTQKVQVSVYR